MYLYWRMICLKKLDPYFIINLPNGKKLLFRSGATRWVEMIDVVKYFKDEYDADITLAHVDKRTAKKYFKGKLQC